MEKVQLLICTLIQALADPESLFFARLHPSFKSDLMAIGVRQLDGSNFSGYEGGGEGFGNVSLITRKS